MQNQNFVFNFVKPNFLNLTIQDITMFPFRLLIIFFFNLLNIKILYSPLEAIGHQITDLECFFLERKKYSKTKLLIFGRYPFIANEYLLNNFQLKGQKNIIVIKNYYICLILFFLTRTSKFKKKISFNTEKYAISDDGDYIKIFNKNFSKIRKKFRINDSSLFLDFLKKNKINNQKIVTIHLRSSHLKKHDGENYRSVEPKNYIKTINWLCKKNFKVIKFGNKDLNFKIKNKNFLDLDKFNLNRSQFEEIFVNIISNSYFSICTNSGPSQLNFIYDIPCFFSNGAPMGHSIFVNYKSISTFKLYYSLISKKFLSINEIKKMNLDNFRSDTLFANNKIRLIDNNSDDILLVTKELIKKIKRNNFKSNLFTNKINSKIKINTYCKDSRGTISENFVKKYKNILLNTR